MLYPDIYFEPDYARLYEAEDSKATEYRFESEHGLITHLFMKRSLPFQLAPGTAYYDLITPYGYGGPIIHHTTDKQKLIAGFLEDFGRYAAENHIIAEFVRFHPLIGNGVDFQDAYGSVYDRKTVGTNLTYDDVIGTEFSKHKRKDIRRSLKQPGVRYEVNEHPQSLDDFVDIYYSTMERDKASDFYFFPPEYFRRLLNAFPDHITTGKVFLDDQLIAMGLYFRYGRFLHAHLSGTKTEFLAYSPACILKYALALYGHEKGYEVIHYGGGTSNSPDNSLYKYKKEYGKNTEFDFYTARKIWNDEAYRQACQMSGADPDSDFFPAYRKTR